MKWMGFKMSPLQLVMLSLPVTAWAGGVQAPEKALDDVSVTDSRLESFGVLDAATQGTVTAKQLEGRPSLRPGDILETVPGLIVTQHSGDGKANQYFLRGFNLDHGTDLRTTVLGMPINNVGHAHGQGYTDINFLIPELVKTLQYKKGPYYAEEGDFSSAGAVGIDYFSVLPKNIASVTAGEHQYARTLLAQSTELSRGNLLYALEAGYQNGPWEQAEHNRKLNGVLRYSLSEGAHQWSVTAMAYHARWTSTDHIPVQAVDSGLVNRFGTLDPTSGGQTHRYSVSADWKYRGNDTLTTATIYSVDYQLNLFSNFTYFTKNPRTDPVTAQSLDQFNQFDSRKLNGLHVDHTRFGKFLGRASETSVGLDVRQDHLNPVALYDSVQRERTITRSLDTFSQNNLGVYARHSTTWTDWFRTVVGVRRDLFRAHVNGQYDDDGDATTPLLPRSGNPRAGQTSPKLSLIMGPFNKTEFFVSAGKGFHSNDPRGVVTPTQPTPFIASSWGEELGVRNAGWIKGLQLSAALFRLKSQSELVFVGDAGTTEPKAGSLRRGVELSAYYAPNSNWTLDADIALTRARYLDNPAGQEIPNAIRKTIALGTIYKLGKTSVGYRFRYFGPAPLDEAGSLQSASSLTSSLLVSHEPIKNIKVFGEVLNLFNRRNSDIEYAQDYALPTAPGVTVNGKTFHPAEPRTLRAGVIYNF